MLRIQLDFYLCSRVVRHPRLEVRYQILEHIATGGMAEVYKAKLIQSNGFSKIVVIKKIVSPYEKDRQWIDSFFREAKMMSALNHSNITHIYHLGDVGVGKNSLVMEFVEGGSLYDLKNEAGTVPLEFVSFIVTEILKGLGYAHKKGVLHRDLSPSNILISMEGEVKITDFGIARYRDGSEITAGLQGKPAYMSPEQRAGRRLTESSDLYSVALILYKLLTGMSSRDPRGISLEQYPALKKALGERPEDRFSTAEEFEEALRKEWGSAATQREFSRYLLRYRPWARPRERTAELKAGRIFSSPEVGSVGRYFPSLASATLPAREGNISPHTLNYSVRRKCISLLLILSLFPLGLQPPAFSPHGYLSLNARPWAKIYAENQTYFGMTPIIHRRMPIGKYQLFVIHPDFKKTKTIFVEIKANEALKQSFKF